MNGIRAWARHLRTRFLLYDTEFFGLMSAAIALYWATWLFFNSYTQASGIDPPPYYALLRNLFPHWMLTVFFFTYGGGYVAAFLMDSTPSKRLALLMGAGLWSLVAYSTYFSYAEAPGLGLFVIFSLGCGWAFLRQKGTDSL